MERELKLRVKQKILVQFNILSDFSKQAGMTKQWDFVK